MAGRRKKTWTAITSNTRTAAPRASKKPKRRRPHSNSVSGARRLRCSAMWPISVVRAVATITARASYLNATLQTGLANPLDEAVIAFGRERGWTTTGVAKLDEMPYDFARKRMSVVVREPDAPRRIITKGAVHEVVAVCAYVRSSGADAVLDEVRRAEIEERIRRWSMDGYRVLAAATREVAAAAYTRADERDMSLIGFLLCMDPPEPQAAHNLKELARLGVAVKIVTGDNRYVAAHVAEAVGVRGEGVVTGAELNAMNDEALWQRAPRIHVFAEVDPNQKERIIRALRK